MVGNYTSYSVEDLIELYGESQNTVWIETKFLIYREPESGIPLGYAPSRGYAITWCNPLCKKEDYEFAARRFVDWCVKEKGWKVVWGVVNEEMMRVLVAMGWSALSCIQDDQLNPMTVDPMTSNKSGVRRPVEHARKSGLTVQAQPSVPTGALKEAIDECCTAWKGNRKGTQVHTSNLEPWNDTKHRRYWVARGESGKIVGFLFITKLREGWVIKDCLEYPKLAPKGTSECLILDVIQTLAKEGCDHLTFGPSAAEQMTVVANLKGIRVKGLTTTYNTIVGQVGLVNRGSFRAKFQTTPQPLYVCFPKHGLGSRGVLALMAVLKSEGAGGPKTKNGVPDDQLAKELQVDVSPELPAHGLLGLRGAMEVVKSKFGSIRRSSSTGGGEGDGANGKGGSQETVVVDDEKRHSKHLTMLHITEKAKSLSTNVPSRKSAAPVPTSDPKKPSKHQLKKKKYQEKKARVKALKASQREAKEQERIKNSHDKEGISERMEFAEEDFAKDRYGTFPVNPTSKKRSEEPKSPRQKITALVAEDDDEDLGLTPGSGLARIPSVAFERVLEIAPPQPALRRKITELLASPTPEERDGDPYTFRARLEHFRITSSKLVFIVLRQQQATIQAVLKYDRGLLSKQMLKWIKKIPLESVVLVEGTLRKAKQRVRNCTIKELEILVSRFHVISEAKLRPAFDIEDAERKEADFLRSDVNFARIKLETRLDNRVLDLRTIENQAIFRINSGVVSLFRSFLESKNFTEIHTPKLQVAATESGASVFKVQYFKTNAYLAQSPQLHKQMCIAADMEKVFEVGPVFRAEDSNTHRHLTEFTGLDLEMAFEQHYHEVRDLIDETFKTIFNGLKTKFAKEIEIVREQFPCDEFVFPEKTVVLRFKEGVEMLRASGVELDELEDLNTENEKKLGALVKEKFGTDYYILDKFPSGARPFYTMPDPDDDKWCNAYDFFMRGEEILSGAQRIHDPDLLKERMKHFGINPDEMQDYVNAFALGCPPHGGGGIGLERVVMLFLKLGNIRRASLFPRDPKRLAP